MKKKVLSMALVSAMAVSLFGGVTVSAEESEIGGSLIICCLLYTSRCV